MDDKKIAVIIHATDEHIFQDAVKNFQTLQVPENFSVEFLQAQGEKKFQAYNVAMKKSDAKYKIYLDEKAVILQKNILSKVIETFQADEKIGVIGLSGAIQLSTHGICLQSAKRVGKTFFGAQKVFSDFADDAKNFVEVEAVDNFFLATQHDIDWREDLFADNYFGFAAQCLEFKRENLKTVALLDNAPQVWFDATNFSLDEQAQKIFLEEYKNIFPLVTVIIPSFNRPKFFQEALESVLNQTYRNFEIVISDDSTNDDTENLMQPYLEKYSCIKYFRNKGFTSHDNWNFLRSYNNPDAEFVNWLMDDDLFLPRKFERMIEVYRNNPEVALVTSSKNGIDKDGNILGDSSNLFPQDIVIEGNKAARLLFDWGNYIGEPTTVLIKKEFLRDNDLCFNDDETGFFSLVDVSTWLQLLSKGNFYRLKEILSAQRVHSGQGTNWSTAGILFGINYVKLFKNALDRKLFFTTDAEKYSATLWLLKYCLPSLTNADAEKQKLPEYITLKKTFVALSQSLLNNYKFEMPEIKYSETDSVNKMH